MSRRGFSSSAMTRDPSTRSTSGSGRSAISQKRCRARAGWVNTRPSCIVSILHLQRQHPPAEGVADGHLRLLLPIEQDDHYFPGSSNLSATVFADLVMGVERRGPHFTNANTDADRLHPDLVTEVDFRPGDDERDVGGKRAAGDVEPEV